MTQRLLESKTGQNTLEIKIEEEDKNLSKINASIDTVNGAKKELENKNEAMDCRTHQSCLKIKTASSFRGDTVFFLFRIRKQKFLPFSICSIDRFLWRKTVKFLI